MRSTDHRQIGGYKVIAMVMTRTAQIHRGEKLPYVVLLEYQKGEYMTARWEGESPEFWHAGEYDLSPQEAVASMSRRSGQDCDWIRQLINYLPTDADWFDALRA